MDKAPDALDVNEKMPPNATSGAQGEEFANQSSPAAAASTTAILQPDYDAAIAFLRRVHPGRPWCLTAISLDKRSVTTDTFDDERAGDCRKWLGTYGADRNIYWSVGEVYSRNLKKKAERTDIVAAHWWQVDIDPRAGEDIAKERTRALGLLNNPPAGVPKPTLIVDSGGGYQAFWQLAEPLMTNRDLAAAEDAKRYNLALELRFGADNTSDTSRLMRIPGTLNRPDEKKLRKGRQLTLATVVKDEVAHVYALSEFKQSQPTQLPGVDSTATRASRVTISGNIRRIDDVKELVGVPDRAKVVIVQGIDPDEPNKFSGRSEWLFYAVCAMVRAGISDDTVYSVITDPQFAISKSVLDKGGMIERYALRQIERAHEDAVSPELRELNDRHAVIMNWGGKAVVVEEQFDEAMNRFRLTKQSFGHFKDGYMNRKVDIGTKDKPRQMNLGDWWLNNQLRRQYRRLTFAPGRETPDAYNLWQGFACEAQPGDCTLFLDHLRQNVCGGVEERFDYLIKWMARAVQTPATPGYAAVVMRGGQGTGKSIVAKTFGSLFGRHFMQVTDPKHLVGSFNAHLRDCVVLFGDEAFYAGDKKHASILKMLVTEESLMVEAKGVDAETSPNYVHLLLASNDEWVVPAEKGDRRYFVLDVSDARKEDHVYFRAIHDQMNNGGREALLYYLNTFDLTGFHVRRVPKTDALRDQQARSLRGLEAIVFGWLSSGVLPFGDKMPYPKVGRRNRRDPAATGAAVRTTVTRQRERNAQGPP